MEKSEKFQKKLGEPGYLNKNCWLIRSLNYAPYRRCQYCELKFRNCLFLHYQVVSAVLLILILVSSFLIERKNSEFLIIVVFTLVIVYGYFFNKSTDKLIQANFNEREAKELLEDFNKTLQQKVDEQTKEIRQQKEEVEKAYEVEKKGRRLEEKARKDLQRLDEAKSQFMLATQHHLRTPLTSMYGYLDLLLTGSYGKISQKVKEILGKFQKSTKNEIKIVEELLNISKIQLGEDVVFLQPDVDIESILNEIIEDLKPEAEQKGIYLKMEKPGKLPKIKADQSKLKMALSNIIDNAVKYTEKGGVLIKLETTDSQLRVITKDTGIGIDKEEAENLFTRIFERSKTAQKMFTTGRGIGLFISAKIIEGHKGKAWAESEGLGKGSTFFVELPIG